AGHGAGADRSFAERREPRLPRDQALEARPPAPPPGAALRGARRVSGPDFRVEGADELRVAQPSEDLDTPAPGFAEETEASEEDDGPVEHAPGDLRIP